MNSTQTRRATVDDLPKLTELWQSARLPVADLEKCFTDFQLVEGEKGNILAAVGLHIVASNGRVYSAAYSDETQKETLRPVLWTRLQAVAQNHGLFRLWTEERDPFWVEKAGFSTPTAEVLQKLPESYGPQHEAWRVLRLKDEGADPEYLEKQFAMFKETHRTDREKLMGRSRMIKFLCILFAAVVFAFAMIILFTVFKMGRRR